MPLLLFFLLSSCTILIPIKAYQKVKRSKNSSVDEYLRLCNGNAFYYLGLMGGVTVLFGLGLLSWLHFISHGYAGVGSVFPITSGVTLYLYAYYADKLRQEEGATPLTPDKFFMLVAEPVWPILVLVFFIAIIQKIS